MVVQDRIINVVREIMDANGVPEEMPYPVIWVIRDSDTLPSDTWSAHAFTYWRTRTSGGFMEGAAELGEYRHADSAVLAEAHE
jgi:hypothetical protein